MHKRKRTKIERLWFLRGVPVAFLLFFLLFPSLRDSEEGKNFYKITLNGEAIGALSSRAQVFACMRQARKDLAGQGNDFILAESDLRVEGESRIFGVVSGKRQVIRRMMDSLNDHRKSLLHKSFTVKINQGYTVNLSSMKEVKALISAAKDKYDEKNAYQVEIGADKDRALHVLSASLVSRQKKRQEEESVCAIFAAGVDAEIDAVFDSAEPDANLLSFQDFDLGLKGMSIEDRIEIVESYLPQKELTSLKDAISEVTKDKETNKIYEVKAGDTLSVIAQKYGLTVAKLVSMNPTLENENSLIRPQDELIVTVPEPLLTIAHQTEAYLEEDYEADVKYVDNPSWYTDETKVLQDPVAGHRKVIALEMYSNENLTGRQIIKEEVVAPAVPKIVERGTRVRPTYIKPISGGRLSSGFGRRVRPRRGASSFHKGVDFSTPIGTAVKASSAGTVTRASWGRGYGYCVYISHPDGRETRYGHLSRVLVHAGEKVDQGQKIALSGNTGVSTGPHLHFEILIGGAQVDPMKYIGR